MEIAYAAVTNWEKWYQTELYCTNRALKWKLHIHTWDSCMQGTRVGLEIL